LRDWDSIRFRQENNAMALINCPECGKQVSTAAQSCPSCGYPITNQPLMEPPPDSKSLLLEARPSWWQFSGTSFSAG